MIPGETLRLNVTLISEYADDEKTLTYTSSAPDVAKVDQNGNVTILKVGVCNIVIADPYGLQTVATITVVEKRPNANPGITFEKEVYEVVEGEVFDLGVLFVPEYEGDDDTLTFVVEDPTLFTVENGVVTTLKAGICKLTASGADGKYTATVTVKIANKTPGITLDKQEVLLEVNGEETVNATFVPTYPTDSTVLVWTLEKEGVVTVAEGKITAASAGVCTVTVKNEDGTYTATVTVKVANENPGITPEKQEISLEIGAGESLNAVFVPKYPGDDETLTYETADGEGVIELVDNQITALEHIRKAISMEPGNPEYREVLERIQQGSYSYRQRKENFRRFTGTALSCCTTCGIATLLYHNPCLCWCCI
jgi:uncharacterized protein YjdB